MSRERKFTFFAVSNYEKPKMKKHGATINPKNGTMMLPKWYIIDNSLNGAYVRFYFDASKKALAWKKLEREQGFENMKDYRQLKFNKAGSCVVSVAKALTALGISKDEDTYKDLEIGSYEDKGFFSEKVDYVVLEHTEKKKSNGPVRLM